MRVPVRVLTHFFSQLIKPITWTLGFHKQSLSLTILRFVVYNKNSYASLYNQSFRECEWQKIMTLFYKQRCVCLSTKVCEFWIIFWTSVISFNMPIGHKKYEKKYKVIFELIWPKLSLICSLVVVHGSKHISIRTVLLEQTASKD